VHVGVSIFLARFVAAFYVPTGSCTHVLASTIFDPSGISRVACVA